MPTEVPKAHTPLSIPQWQEAIRVASQQLGLPLSWDALAVLWSQFAIETGRGKACWNWNLGNKRHTVEPTYFILPAAWECGTPGQLPAGAQIVTGPGMTCEPGQVVYILPGHAQKFAAFDVAVAGCIAYLQFLTRPSYAGPWGRVLAGDAFGFAQALKNKGYYTAPVSSYASGLASMVREYKAKAPPLPIHKVEWVREPGLHLGDDSVGNPFWWHEVQDTLHIPYHLRGLVDESAPEVLLASSLTCLTCEDPPETC